jgi:hypothetical protein
MPLPPYAALPARLQKFHVHSRHVRHADFLVLKDEWVDPPATPGKVLKGLGKA